MTDLARGLLGAGRRGAVLAQYSMTGAGTLGVDITDGPATPDYRPRYAELHRLARPLRELQVAEILGIEIEHGQASGGEGASPLLTVTAGR